FTVDLADARLARNLRVARPRLDLDAVLWHARSGDVVGLQAGLVNGVDGQRAEIWDADPKGLAQAVDQQLPHPFNAFHGFSQDEQRYLLYSSGNAQPGKYYMGHRANGSLALLGDTYPQLPEKHLAGKQQVRIVARDGLPLNAFLTRPRGSAGKGL